MKFSIKDFFSKCDEIRRTFKMSFFAKILNNKTLSMFDRVLGTRLYIDFNPNRSKQIQEIVLLWHLNKIYHPAMVFNNIPVKLVSVQKYLDIYLNK